MNREVVIVGIAGGSASGKTTVAKRLADYFGDNQKVKIITQDDYYKDQSHMPFEQRVLTNYDHPNAFDMDLLVNHLCSLKKRHAISKPTYDFSQHTRSDVVEDIQPSDIIILEGLFVLAEERLRDLCDVLIYIDTDSDVRFIRRLKRDCQERGRTLDNVCSQYLTTVKPMFEAFIEPSKKYADIIVPGNGNNDIAIDLFITKMKSIID